MGRQDGSFGVADPHLASLAVSGMIVRVRRWYRRGGNLSVDAVCDGFPQLALNLVRCDLQETR